MAPVPGDCFGHAPTMVGMRHEDEWQDGERNGQGHEWNADHEECH
jgi:hypothetical protein